jgi:uncharacterized protein
MIGVILVAVSWILLRLEGQGLDALGFNAPIKRAKQLGLGLLVAGSAVVVQQMGMSWATGVAWHLNPALTGSGVLSQARANLNSVLFEELVFRGYLLYQAIRLFGTKVAIPIGAAAFGVYHWFSYGVLGAPVPMIYVFVITGAMDWMFCTAFASTRSVFAPIGLHLGWNAVSYMIFSGGPWGPGLFVADGGAGIEGLGMMQLLFNVLLPMTLVALVCWYCVRGMHKADEAFITEAVA